MSLQVYVWTAAMFAIAIIGVLAGAYVGVGRVRRARPKFQIFRDETEEYRFRLKAPNGEIIGVSEGYKSKSGCKGGIESVKRNAPAVAMVDLTAQA